MTNDIKVWEFARVSLGKLMLSFGETELKKMYQAKEVVFYTEKGIVYETSNLEPLDKDLNPTNFDNNNNMQYFKLLTPKKRQKVDFSTKENFYVVKPKEKYDYCKQCVLYLYIDNENIILNRLDNTTKVYEEETHTTTYNYNVFELSGTCRMGGSSLFFMELKNIDKVLTEFGKQVETLENQLDEIETQYQVKIVDSWKIPYLLKYFNVERKNEVI